MSPKKVGGGILDYLDRIEAKLDALLDAQAIEFIMEASQMADLSALQDEVAQNSDAVQSAVTLLDGLSTQLKDALAAGDPQQVQDLVDQLDASTSALAEAVARNTPADPNPAPPEEPAPEEPPA